MADAQSTDQIANEQWKPVPLPEFADDYEVSDMGRVRRRRPGCPSANGARTIYPAGMFLRFSSAKGYPMVHLSTGGRRGKTVPVTVHKLVALAFLGPRPDGAQVNHKSGDKQDSRAVNLEYVTDVENKRHAWDTGLCTAKKGEECSWSKLTYEKAQAIRELYAAGGISQKAVAEKFGVSQMRVNYIVRGKAWVSSDGTRAPVEVNK